MYVSVGISALFVLSFLSLVTLSCLLLETRPSFFMVIHATQRSS